MYFSEMATIWHLFPTLLLVSTTNRLPAWTSKVFISQWSRLKNPGDVFSWWLNVSWPHVRIDNFVDTMIITQAPCQPQEKIIFIQAPCQDKTTASWSKYNVNNKRNIFIQAAHLDLWLHLDPGFLFLAPSSTCHMYRAFSPTPPSGSYRDMESW